MADDNGTGTDTVDPNASTTGTEPTETEVVDYKAEAEKWKALSRKHENEAKKGLKASETLAKLEADKLSAEEKLTKERDELAARLATFESSRLRSEVAAAKKLPSYLANRLQGSTKEEIEADAEALLKDMAPAPADLKNGNRGPANKGGDGSMNNFIQGLRRGR